MRVSARLDDESERQLKFLVDETGLSISAALEVSIALYYEKLRAKHPPRLAKLRAHIGRQGSGHSDVATRAKELFAVGIDFRSGSTVGGRDDGS